MRNASPSLAALTETVNGTQTALVEIKAMLQAQSAALHHLGADIHVLQQSVTTIAAQTEAITELRSELQAFHDELMGLQFVPRFDYISDSVRRIRLKIEEYEQTQSELNYLPDALNEVFTHLSTLASTLTVDVNAVPPSIDPPAER